MNPYGLTDSLAGISSETPVCERCGSVARLDRGCCLVCLLRPALEGEGSDGEAFAAALAASRGTLKLIGGSAIIGSWRRLAAAGWVLFIGRGNATRAGSWP